MIRSVLVVGTSVVLAAFGAMSAVAWGGHSGNRAESTRGSVAGVQVKADLLSTIFKGVEATGAKAEQAEAQAAAQAAAAETTPPTVSTDQPAQVQTSPAAASQDEDATEPDEANDNTDTAENDDAAEQAARAPAVTPGIGEQEGGGGGDHGGGDD